MENDGKILISIGKSRFETAWKNKEMLWSELLKRLSTSVTTPETHAEVSKPPERWEGKNKGLGGVGGRALKGRTEKDRSRSSPSDPHARPRFPSG